MLALRLARPGVLVDLNRIGALTHLVEHDGELRIGAMARQAAAAVSPLVRRLAPLLPLVLAEVGHPPTRTRGTVGGSVAHADPAADLTVAMLALDAKFLIRSSSAQRTVLASDFFKGMFETEIAPGELLAEIRIPSREGGGAGYQKMSYRRGDFAIVAIAAHLEAGSDGTCRRARLALGAVGPVPVRCHEAEDFLVGRGLDVASIARAAALLPDRAFELDSPNASRAYRKRIAPVLARRALTAARNNAQQVSV
jgi:carbon-monoxide dehydrogenase medium subunit